MYKEIEFSKLVDQMILENNTSHMRPVIEKELLHYDILFALDLEGLLDSLTFQGGTLLRLCYGAHRFSEDLDFAGGKNFKSNNLIAIKDCIQHYIGKRYNLEVLVKQPEDITQNGDYSNINISKWQISIITLPRHKDLPQQRIKIEVTNIPKQLQNA